MPRVRTRALSNRHPEQETAGLVVGSRTVLCLEDQPHAAGSVVEQLEQHGGIKVVYCHPPGTTAPCVGVTGSRCPLDDPVAVVLDVRSGADRQLTRGELGVVCAEQQDVPIIAVGQERPQRSNVPWASATCSVDDAAEFCSSLMSSPVPLRQLRIDHLVRRSVTRTGDDVGDLSVTVTDWASEPVISVASERLPSTESCAAIDAGLHGLLDGPYAVVYTTVA